MPHRPVPQHQRSNARKLRRTMTDVERKLWEVLRAGRLGGVNFKRQEPIGPYIADFVCHTARLVIELDGSQHNEAAHLSRDEARDRFIMNEGYLVLRFWTFEINSEFDAVVDRIYVSLIEQGLQIEPSGIGTTPPPQGGRRRKTQDLALGVSSPLGGEGQGGG